jgi:hypothetical protein
MIGCMTRKSLVLSVVFTAISVVLARQGFASDGAPLMRDPGMKANGGAFEGDSPKLSG